MYLHILTPEMLYFYFRALPAELVDKIIGLSGFRNRAGRLIPRCVLPDLSFPLPTQVEYPNSFFKTAFVRLYVYIEEPDGTAGVVRRPFEPIPGHLKVFRIGSSVDELYSPKYEFREETEIHSPYGHIHLERLYVLRNGTYREIAVW